MSNHISDDLPRLLTGDASRDITMAASEHLRTCPDCQQELVSAVVAHASLASAHRFAPEIVNPESRDRHDEPASTPLPPLPDLSPMFEQVREEARSASAARPHRRRQIGVAVAAAALVAAGVVTIATTSGSDAGPQTQSVALSSLSGSLTRSTATLVGSDRLRIDASSLPRLSAGRAYEVWLTDSHASVNDAPQSVGFIDSDRKADLAVQSWLLSQYDTIAVSVQKPHQTEYSGDTVLSGTYRS